MQFPALATNNSDSVDSFLMLLRFAFLPLGLGLGLKPLVVIIALSALK